MKVLVIIYLLFICVLAQNNNNNGSQFGGLFGGLLSIPANAFREAMNTAGDAIKYGAQTGRTWIDFGRNQMSRWTNIVANGLGGNSSAPNSQLFPLRKNPYRRTTTTTTTTTTPRPVMSTSNNVLSEESIRKQISNLKKDLESMGTNNSWFSEVVRAEKLKRIKKLEEILEYIIGQQTDNDINPLDFTRTPVDVNNLNSIPTIPSSSRPVSPTEQNIVNPTTDDTILPVISK